MGSMTGKTAVVTGGSRGIGRAICLELARRGANVVFSYAGNTAAAEKTLAELKELGVEARAIQGNVADPAAAKTLIDTAVKELGGIHILVNNAGITRDGLAMAMKEEDFDAVIETNLKGAFLCMKAAIRPMMKARYGRIVNLSSVVALRGNPGQVNYCASKAGLIGMTKSLAKEMGARGITVNAVAPGYISTDMTAALPDAARDAMLSTIPVGRAGSPEDVAAAVAFLASEEAGYITGQVLSVDGGMGM
ncbi:MAG TPA: 3-oxoacyl-[acyl-carrier-protein] reductase [Candidatus Faecalibacterium intestinigallinarum]|uniref:3-oxoacyl-[acyl-carrier-protein] reductase n=1 Tax=Candidatus Faecalibacterium intestinigallinarum TaxID=2838581 RepID=A0A9D1QAI0_9FIRM|nr:3-oxoacyl-[acyl-carrier-protein] reductase [Candidatus Faecalibacterium intestinigallinarum]